MPLHTQESLNSSASWALWHIGEEESELYQLLSPSPGERAELALLHHPQRRLEWLASRLLLKELARKHGISRPNTASFPQELDFPGTGHGKKARVQAGKTQLGDMEAENMETGKFIEKPSRVEKRSFAEKGSFSREGKFFQVLKDPWGKPQLCGTPFFISLSHSFPYAAAILHEKQAVGIDIETPRQQLLRIQQKFLSREEQIGGEENPRKLCIYWAAKEALYKLYGRRELIFQEQIHIQPFQLAGQGKIKGELHLKEAKEAYSLHYRYIQDLLICFSL